MTTKRKRAFVNTYCSIFLISLICFCLPSVSAAGDGDSSLAKKVSGTWLFEPGSEFQILMNINADGTLIWSNSVEYNPAFPNGAVFGVWKRTGKRQITTTELGFLYDEEGVHILTGRVKQVFDFDKDFQSLSAEFIEDIFTPNQDPTNFDEEPIFSFGGEGIIAKRLNNLAGGRHDEDDD